MSRGKAKSAALTSDHAVVERDKETAEFEGPGGRAAVITVDVTVMPSEDEEFSVSVDTDNTDDHHPATDVDNRGSEVADGQPLLSDPRKKYDNLLKTIRIGPRRGVINQVLFTSDGRHLITANQNGTIYVLRLNEWS